MLFSYNLLQSFFKKKLPRPQKLAEILTMNFAEVEELKKTKNDFTLDIDVRPNRASDCFSHMGVAREIAAILDCDLKIKNQELKEEEDLKAKDFLTVEVKEKEACLRYAARVVCDVKVGPSPKWLRDYLEACGLRPINNIVDATNYVMLETGQPLHAFDNKKIGGKKIIVRFAKDEEKIITLDGERYNLNKNVLVIADFSESIAVAGIKGGKKAEISNDTKTIVLEAANFNSQTVRSGSKEINLKTDASLRFEHGLDPNLAELAINKTALLIQEIAGGKIAQGLIDIYPRKVLPKKIVLNLDYVEGLLGIKIPLKEIKNILRRLTFQYCEARPCHIEVEVPTFRQDVSIAEDLIEEIGRIFGYEKIPAIFPSTVLIPPKRNLNIFWEDFAKNILKEAGFTEVYNYSFISGEDSNTYPFIKEYKNKYEILELENPLSNEQKYLSPSLIPNILKNVKNNISYFKEIKIFELGKAYKKIQSPKPKAEEKFKFQIIEKRMLTGLITGEAFYQAKGAVDTLLNKLGISGVWYDEYRSLLGDGKLDILNPAKSAEIKIDREKIGFLGEISQKFLTGLGISEKTVIFDIDFEKLQTIALEEYEYRPISRFPAAIRDIAVLVPGQVRVEEVLNKIYDTGGVLIRDVELFDIYEGEELPEGKKNLAFHIIFQAEDRTLSSKEIDDLQDKIIAVLERDPEWQVRK